MRTVVSVALAMTFCAALAACGGGGGGDDGPTGPTLDQSFDPTATGLNQENVNVNQRLGQTFTALHTGTLERVDLMLAQSIAGGAVAVTIMPTVAGLPDNNDTNSLGGAVIFDGSLSGALTWTTVELGSSNIQITAGQTYAICLGFSTGTYDWGASSGLGPDQFTQGQGCGRNQTGDWWTAHPQDFAFRVWVQQ